MSCPGVLDYSNLTVNGGMENVLVPDESVAVPGGVIIE